MSVLVFSVCIVITIVAVMITISLISCHLHFSRRNTSVVQLEHLGSE